MKRKKREFKQECARRLRKAYDRMRLLPGVEQADLNALIDTWEHLEAEVSKDIRRKNRRSRSGYNYAASHAGYRDRGGLDLP